MNQETHPPPKMLPPVLGDDVLLLLEMLAAANKLFASPNNDPFDFVEDWPNTEACVVCGDPNTDDGVVWGLPNTEVWVTAVGVPKTVLCVVTPNTDDWFVGVADPKTVACVIGEPNTEAWVVGVAEPNTLWVVVTAAPNTDGAGVVAPKILCVVVAATNTDWVVVATAPNTFWVAAGLPKTEATVVVAGLPKTEAGVFVAGLPNTEAAVVVDGLPNTEVGVVELSLLPNIDPDPKVDPVVAANKNSDRGGKPDDPGVVAAAAAPKIADGDAGLGVLKTVGFASVELNADCVVVVPKSEFAAVVVVAAVPNNDPCIPEDENMLAACVVFGNAWEVADSNKEDADVAVVVTGGFAVTTAVGGVDDGEDGCDNVGGLNIEVCDEGVEVGDPKNGCDLDSETKNYQYYWNLVFLMDILEVAP